MNRFKKLIVAILLILMMIPLFATDEEWYMNRPIGAFSFEGLVNVKEKTVSKLLSNYVGQNLTQEVIDDLELKLYSQAWVDYIGIDAEVAENGWDVDLKVYIAESPIIKSVTTVGNERVRKGSILEAQNLVVENFFNTNTASANAELIKNLYLQKGYKDVKVTPEVEYDNEKNEVNIIFDIVEGPQYKVRSIRFVGNSAVSSTELAKITSSKEKTFFNSGNYVQSNVDADKTSILQFYATKGYPDTQIVDVDIETVEEKSTDKITYLNVSYTIEEGELWYVGEVSFSGNEQFDNETVQGLFSINDGDLYNYEKIQVNQDNLASLYYDNGYVYSRLIPTLTRDYDTHKISIHFDIVEGPQSVIEEIRIIGLTKTKPYVLERELAFKVGDIFSRAAFIQSQQNMYNTSLLKNISASLLQGTTENGVICEFTVEEGNQMELQFGATFGATEVNGFPVSGFLSWTNNNLQGTGRSLSVGTTLSPSTQNMNVSISDKWVGDKRWSNGFSFSAERDVRTDALQQGVGSAPYTGRDYEYVTYPFGFSNAHDWYYTAGQVYPDSSYLMSYDYAKFSVGYTSGYSFVFRPGTLSVSAGVSIGLNRAFYDGAKYTPYEELIQKYHENWQFSNKLVLSLSWDGRDLVSYIPHGYVLSGSFTYAGGFLGGLSNYNKLSLSGSVYRGVHKFIDDNGGKGKDLILGFSSEVDFMFKQYWKIDGKYDWYDPTRGATKYEMLYIDGMNIGRGFYVVYDQAFLWHNQIDLTYPLVEDLISLEGFVSATGVQSDLNKVQGLGTINWYLATGFGIKMEIPGFPLGLYLVKNATMLQDNGMKWKWQSGSLFSNSNREGSGMSLVLAITTSIY